jgi:hypothetical protein
MHGGEDTEFCPDLILDDDPEEVTDFEQSSNKNPEKKRIQIELFILYMDFILV